MPPDTRQVVREIWWCVPLTDAHGRDMMCRVDGRTHTHLLSAPDTYPVIWQAMRGRERYTAVRDARFQRFHRVLTEIQLQQACVASGWFLRISEVQVMTIFQVTCGHPLGLALLCLPQRASLSL